MKIPEFNKTFFCIINRDNPVLAAVISSYVSTSDKYLPMFEYSTVTAEKMDLDEEEFNENSISNRRAEEFNVKMQNAINMIGGCDYLILGGLTDNQKSFLDFLDKYNVIEIESHDDVDVSLGAIVNKGQYLSCREDNIHCGLYEAVRKDVLLKIDNAAEDINIEINENKGLIVIENIDAVSTIIAINYAIAINGAIKVIQEPKIKVKEINYLIDEWKKGNEKSFHNLSALLYVEIADINFTDFEYATFFTTGAPYSLILKNIIPFTYVNLLFDPAYFIFNGLYFETKKNIGSSIVFSPVEFKDEETDFVINKLKENNHFVKELIGQEASVYNIDKHISEYPYELLHICSHGGQVDGYSLIEEFTDSKGDKHTVEYDEVVSFAPNRYETSIPTFSKFIIRKFDDLLWRSEELKAKNYPHHVFSDMHNELKKSKGKSRVFKQNVPDSCAIKCIDFNYQGMFNSIAGFYTSPIIFNNTCWSWSGIADSFLAVGARGYIGTLWNIDNPIAKNTAELFYENLFDDTITGALQKSLVHTRGTKDENIYIFWGLHFSTLKTGKSITESKENVARRILDSFYRWTAKIKVEVNLKVKENIQRLIDWNLNQLLYHFHDISLELVGASNNIIESSIKTRKLSRNDKINIIYRNGEKKENIKYKYVERDIKIGNCKII